MLEDLSREELLSLISAYNDYVMNFFDEHENGMYPVCVEEFYLNEYQELINED